MAKNCLVDYFYVIIPNSAYRFLDFDFSYRPEKWDSHYMHIWNNNTNVRLFNKKSVLHNPERYTDRALLNGKTEIKNINDRRRCDIVFDIVFLSYGEDNAEANFKLLSKRFSRAKRMTGVTGICQAHLEAAKIVNTDMFYVVDADAEIVKDFNFDFAPDDYTSMLATVWYSKNPVNGLEYGYGGVKLFPTYSVLNYTGSAIDFTTSVTKNINVIPTISNITKFNTDPFSSWKSGFRECVKLSSKSINNQLDIETEERLRSWCNIGNGQFGDFAVAGAAQGAKFGKENINQPDNLKLINDFEWLKWKFNQQ